jgi:hypothetical protein
MELLADADWSLTDRHNGTEISGMSNRMARVRHVYCSFIGNSERRILLERPKRRWGGIIEMDRQSVVF